eukprot:Amastigsp_a676824_32.p1 type:complete len:268 gc:universal Amastigsp_a676824_32:77-880(+)
MDGSQLPAAGAEAETIASLYARARASLAEDTRVFASNEEQGKIAMFSPYEPLQRCCNCKNSKCLKLYCECFAAGLYCTGCLCKACHNTPAKESERAPAVQATLARNPVSFRPKVIAARAASGDALSTVKHKRGCKCLRSRCLKKYCECFSAGVACTADCVCVDCYNTAPHRDLNPAPEHEHLHEVPVESEPPAFRSSAAASLVTALADLGDDAGVEAVLGRLVDAVEQMVRGSGGDGEGETGSESRSGELEAETHLAEGGGGDMDVE